MANKGTLFQEADRLYRSLLELYFETNETFGATKYNSYHVAAVVQRALSRLARRRDQFISDPHDGAEEG